MRVFPIHPRISRQAGSRASLFARKHFSSADVSRQRLDGADLLFRNGERISWESIRKSANLPRSIDPFTFSSKVRYAVLIVETRSCYGAPYSRLQGFYCSRWMGRPSVVSLPFPFSSKRREGRLIAAERETIRIVGKER